MTPAHRIEPLSNWNGIHSLNLVISPQFVQGHFLARGKFGEITRVQVHARKTGSSVKYDGEKLKIVQNT